MLWRLHNIVIQYIMHNMVGSQHVINTTRTIKLIKCTVTKGITKEPSIKNSKVYSLTKSPPAKKKHIRSKATGKFLFESCIF